MVVLLLTQTCFYLLKVDEFWVGKRKKEYRSTERTEIGSRLGRLDYSLSQVSLHKLGFKDVESHAEWLITNLHHY